LVGKRWGPQVFKRERLGFGENGLPFRKGFWRKFSGKGREVIPGKAFIGVTSGVRKVLFPKPG